MNICVLADSYPSKNNYGGIFVAQLFDEIADLGNNIIIIAPQSISSSLFNKKSLNPVKHVHLTKKKNRVTIYQPYILTFSNFKISIILNTFFKKRAVSKILKKIEIQPDAYYGHFWHNAFILFKIISHSNVPLFVATGESTINFHKQISNKQKTALDNYLKGVICVSTKNKEESITKGLTTDSKCIVIQNAIDNTKFYVKDKMQCRVQLGFPTSHFIVAFTGAFNESKGVNRLSMALEMLNDASINAIFIGRGSLIPRYKGILFKGFLPHNEIVNYLNSADVFVYPTLAEGASNAIIEALACGLPVISSDRPFNYDILNETNSILVNPMDINEIASAIVHLKNNKQLKEQLATGAEESSKNYILSNRAKKIYNYIKQNLNT